MHILPKFPLLSLCAMVFCTQVPPLMYPNVPCTPNEYEAIHGVNHIDTWIEKYQSDLYLKIYNGHSNDSMDFAIKLYPNYVLVILKRHYIFVSTLSLHELTLSFSTHPPS